MSKLSEKAHWDDVHVAEERQFTRSRSKGYGILKRLLGTGLRRRMSAYDEYLLWEVIFPRHLPQMNGAKVVEVGSAPGEFLVRFGKEYNCIPYGIEYSDVGAELNRQVFRRNGFDPDNVIHSDFFSEEFQKCHQNRFDAVISRGFIEHFADVADVINRHLAILAPGGFLIVSVPNLRGVNYGLARIFHKEVIALHNLDIMTKDVFAKLFDRSDVTTLFCDYYGTFSLYLFTSGSPYMQHALRAVQRIQAPLNLAFRMLLKDSGAECPLFSPSLLYIGRKV